MKLHCLPVTIPLEIFATTVASHPDYVLDPDPAKAPGAPAFGSDFTYPFPVHYYFVSQGQHLATAYMDVQLSHAPNHRTVMLMHGKNFCGAT